MFENKNILKTFGSIAFIMLLFVMCLVFSSGDYLFKSQNVNLIEDGWTYENESISLGGKLDIEAGDSYTITTDYPVTSGEYLLLRSSLSDIEVSVNNQKIYEKTYKNSGFIKKPLPSLWHLVEIPQDGQTLRITYCSPYEKMNGLLNPVAYGQKGNLLFHIYDQYGLPFIIDLLILFMGLLMLVIAYINPKKIHNNIRNIGMFSVLSASWLIAESRMLQFFSGSLWLIASLAYVCLALIPIPLVKYIKSFVSDERAKPFRVILRVCWFNLVLIVLMQIFDLKDFFETIWITHGTMAIIILITLKESYYEIKVKNNKIAKHFLLSLSVLFIFAISGLYSFYAFDAKDITVFIRFGLIVFVLMLGMETGRQLLALLKKSYQSEIYRKLAFLDPLTQGPNRTAFESDLEEIFTSKHLLKRLRLVILDMNQLKKINDIHGHVTGDEAIRKTYELINSHFGDIGKTYRIGGDEFACIITNDAPESFQKSCEMFSSSIIEENKYTPYLFGISLGSVTYDPTHDTVVKKMMHRADVNMYRAKKESINIV